MPTRCEIFCEILLAVLLPPVGVCLRHGCCSVEFCICLLLTILGYVPGIIYALYAIVFVDRDEYFDEYRRPLMVAMYYEGKTRIRIQSINAATTSNLILVSSLGLLRWIFRSWYD
ncbi:Low temperature and salt responsive protein family [Citrus sinensis]|nr:Low temperature and salt responsive protein family [Citrus sinensis]